MKNKLFYFMLVLVTLFSVASAQTITYSEILGRPTGTSLTMSILFNQSVETYWEYGTATGVYTANTTNYTASANTPLEVDFTNLQPNTKYYYRTRYRLSGSGATFSTGTEHTFQTKRTSGTTFSFAVQADPHMDSNTTSASYLLTMQNMLSAHPDFMIDLGDNFMAEKLSNKTQAEITNRHTLYRPYYGSACHSVPLFLAMGNHEGELGWLLNGTANSLPVMATNTRKLYYPNPVPNSFYSGDTIPENFVGLRENYYAWEWGNALFVVLDAYWYTTSKPGWGWTLGAAQYNWFKNVLTTSTAKFKFVFCHQLVGGNGTDGRGGSEYCHLYEMGGYTNDTSWGFTTNRPGWSDPVHQLMVQNNASVYFHGHDHCYAKQDKDGIVYQEVPQPSAKNTSNITGTQYGYVNGVLMSNRGYLLVTVTDDSVTVDYVKTFVPSEVSPTKVNNSVAYSYTIKPVVVAPTISVAASATNICAGTSVTFTSMTTNGGVNPVYQWKNNGVNVGTNSSTFTSASLTNGNLISCVITTASGATATSNQITMAVSSAVPARPGVISGVKNSLCNTITNYTYSVPAVANAISYIWSVPANATLVNGQGTTSIEVSYSSLFVSGNIAVQSSNYCGVSALRTLAVSAKPATPVAISGPSAVCANQANVSYSIAAVPGATSYTWAVPTGATISSGKGTTAIVAKFGTSSGNVTVLAKNACGNSAKSTLPVTINCRMSDDAVQNALTVINPFTDEIIFSVNADVTNATVLLCDLTGREIQKWENISFKEKEQQQLSIDKNLGAGTYLLTVKNSSFNLFSKVNH